MPLPVVAGAQTMCSFGLAPSVLNVIPTVPPTLVQGSPPLSILDIAPGVNIVPFGLCTSLANPVTAAQTAAALGVLTPGACTPAVVAPWTPGAPKTLVGKKPALTLGSQCNCAYGGVIVVTNPGTTTTMMS